MSEPLNSDIKKRIQFSCKKILVKMRVLQNVRRQHREIVFLR
ncbi:Uncharacterized protein dnm_017600 [Desulfonema magnum]|uniref:Uncharacterized protein n=1 Tax=Desulfonema magnum TaxID=45655 RepID=A0A975BI18_9BACT|nr:Uncharacterized protein dnm_017600 [Desulfonema magnum]